MRSPLIIGTRGSDLALWQANFVKDLLAETGIHCELKIIRTQGDVMQDLSPDKMEGKGFFTKEIEDALLSEETDIAVHSFKDLPTEYTPGLTIAAVSEREDPSELLLINKKAFDEKRKFSIAKGSSVGTSSARRKSQMLALRPDLNMADIRGNVPTRIAKLRKGDFDAILIALAGVERLNINVSEFHSEIIDPLEIIPAPAQGVIAIQVREKDADLIRALSKINKPETKIISGIERKVLNLFQGGCQTPVGVYAMYDDETEMFSVRAAKAGAWDKMPLSVFSESKTPDLLAQRVVDKFNQIKPCRVFISRHPRNESYLKRVLEGNNFTFEEKALIVFNPIPFANLPDCDWVFFSSKHAVKYFMEQKPGISSQKFACVGKGTADELRQYGKRADFIGAGTDTRMIGKQFASLVGSSKVLFPQAKGSMRSIQQQMVKVDKVVNLVVYETLKKNDGTAPEADVLVFTSPSNVDAWFENYRIAKSQKVVAMGDATAHELKKHNVIISAMSDTFDDCGLARAIFGVFY